MADKYDTYTKAELSRLLRDRDRKPRYGLVWERDEIERDHSINSDLITLEHDHSLSVGAAPYENLLIEGDNFDALRFLRMTHAGKIKCIYIDPPYNTGNRDFIYNDRFVDRDDQYKHSKWIEYMYRRLTLARDLLAPDGIIFVSINDIEMANLKLLMNDVFIEKNALVDFVWQTDGNFDNQARFKVAHEYILAYSANEKYVPPPPVIDPNADESSKLFREEIRNTIVKNGPKNPVSNLVLPAGFPADFEEGTIPARDDKWPHLLNDAVVKNGELQNELVVRSGWANKNLCEAFIRSRFAPVLDTKSQRTRFVLTKNGAIENLKTRSDEQSHVVSVIKNVGSVQSSGEHLIAQGIKFSYPKPVGLIKYLLSMVEGKDFLVLDFFAGSSTSAHAVMELNAEDKGRRRWIMVSSTEATDDMKDKNICRDVAQKRLANAVTGYDYATRSGNRTQAGLGGGFAYLRTRRHAMNALVRGLQDHAVWQILQLIHTDRFAAYDAASLVQKVMAGDTLVLYVPKLNDAALEQIVESIDGQPQSIMYCWNPALLRQRMEGMEKSGVTVENVPQYIVDRFGVKK